MKKPDIEFTVNLIGGGQVKFLSLLGRKSERHAQILNCAMKDALSGSRPYICQFNSITGEETETTACAIRSDMVAGFSVQDLRSCGDFKVDLDVLETTNA